MLSFAEFINEGMVKKVTMKNTEDEQGATVRRIDNGSANIHKHQIGKSIPVANITHHEPLSKTHKDTASDESEASIQHHMRMYKKGYHVDPIVVHRHGGTGKFRVIDGHHRLEAMRRLGVKHIHATVVDKYHIKQGELG